VSDDLERAQRPIRHTREIKLNTLKMTRPVDAHTSVFIGYELLTVFSSTTTLFICDWELIPSILSPQVASRKGLSIFTELKLKLFLGPCANIFFLRRRPIRTRINIRITCLPLRGVQSKSSNPTHHIPALQSAPDLLSDALFSLAATNPCTLLIIPNSHLPQLNSTPSHSNLLF